MPIPTHPFQQLTDALSLYAQSVACGALLLSLHAKPNTARAKSPHDFQARLSIIQQKPYLEGIVSHDLYPTLAVNIVPVWKLI